MESEIRIVYEDEDTLAIDKPSGLSVHADGKTDSKTLVDWVRARYPSIEHVGEPLLIEENGVTREILRPGIVHRLDKETSGVMLIAKTEPSYLFLKRQFMKHEIKKRYHAFVYGSLPDARGTIDRPIGRSPTDFRKRSAVRSAGGEMREAVTRYIVLIKGTEATFVEAQPLTGRTHQIRVHFLSVGHPVIADPLYARGRQALLGFSRLALHAKAITFRRPGGKEMTVEADYPADFKEAIEELKGKGGEPAALLRRS